MVALRRGVLQYAPTVKFVMNGIVGKFMYKEINGIRMSAAMLTS
jgi:hypothetical protein